MEIDKKEGFFYISLFCQTVSTIIMIMYFFFKEEVAKLMTLIDRSS